MNSGSSREIGMERREFALSRFSAGWILLVAAALAFWAVISEAATR